MKNALRTIALVLAFTLPGLALTACDTSSDCDAASPHTGVEAAAFTTGKGGGKGPGGKSRTGKSRTGSGKSKARQHSHTHHDLFDDDCEDDD